MIKKHNQKYLLIIVTIITVSLALLLRLSLGSNLMFYAYHNNIKFFPGRALYNFLYIFRIFLCSYIITASACDKLTAEKRKFINGNISLLCLYFEYWLVFFKESILTAILLCILTIYINLKYLKRNLLCKHYSFLYYVVIFLFCLIQLIMIISLISMII